MNILIINYEYPPLGGGGGVATRDLAEELASRQHQVHVITTHHADWPVEETKNNVHIHRVKVAGRKQLPTSSLLSLITFFPAAFWRGVFLCRRVNFDVINAQFIVPSGVPALLLSWLYRTPLVVSLIGGDLYDPSKGISPHRYAVLRALIRFIASQSAALTAISEDTRQRARELHGITQPITVTHLGVRLVTVAAATREDLSLPVGVAIALTIGRLVPRKKYDLLLAAWRAVPNAHLVIIGDGPLRKNLEQLRNEYGLANRVHMPGYVAEEQKQQMLRVSDLYVSAAEHEGFGIVYLEAMLAGLPIVTTDNGGQVDFLTAEANALLVSPGDPDALAGAVIRVLADRSLSGRMKTNNQLRVQNFLVDKTTARFEQVLLGVTKTPYAYRH